MIETLMEPHAHRCVIQLHQCLSRLSSHQFLRQPDDHCTRRPQAAASLATGLSAEGQASMPQQRLVAERRWRLGMQSRGHPSAIIAELLRALRASQVPAIPGHRQAVHAVACAVLLARKRPSIIPFPPVISYTKPRRCATGTRWRHSLTALQPSTRQLLGTLKPLKESSDLHS